MMAERGWAGVPVFSTKDEAYQHALKTVAELQAAGYEAELVVEDNAPAAPGETLSAQVVALTASGSYEPTASGALQFIEAADHLQKTAPPETPAEEWKQAAKAVADYLKTLPPEELKKAAAAKGIAYASLAGSTDGGKCGSLVFLLNPVYSSPGALAKKAKIQQTLAAKFAALPEDEKKAVLQQEAEWKAALGGGEASLPGDLGAPKAGQEEAGEAEMTQRLEKVREHAEALQALAGSWSLAEIGTRMSALVYAVHAVYALHVPGKGLAWHKKHYQKAREVAENAVKAAPADKGPRTLWWWAAVCIAAERHGLSRRATVFLPRASLITLLFAPDGSGEADWAKGMAQKAEIDLDVVFLAIETVFGLPVSGEGLTWPQVMGYAEALWNARQLLMVWWEKDDKFGSAQTLIDLVPDAAKAIPHPLKAPDIAMGRLHSIAERALKAMPPSMLREQALTYAGLDAKVVKVATPAQLRAIMLGKLFGEWVPTCQIKAKQAWGKVHAKLAGLKEKELAAKQPEPAPSLAHPPLPDLKAPTYTPPPPPRVIQSSAALGKVFSERMRAAAGILLQRRVAAKLHAGWKGREAVRSTAFQYDSNAGHLGGVHEKHFYRDPDGRRWLFKPDKHGGAVAAAEEAAAEVARRVGLPAVEVRRVELDGRVGSVQPMLAAASPLPGNPSEWTPEQRQGVMMHHVVDWLLGDHDGNPGNFVLAEGVPLRIDRGQSFKFMGKDKLDLSYEPNKHHGAPPHAALLLYRAAAQGQVQVDPHTLLPVIKAAQGIPDDEYRAMLRPVAEAGVKSKKAAWYQAMYQRAAAKKGGEPSPNEVVDAFLDAAVERKRNLRSDFEAFFTKVFGQPFRFVESAPAAQVAV